MSDELQRLCDGIGNLSIQEAAGKIDGDGFKEGCRKLLEKENQMETHAPTMVKENLPPTAGQTENDRKAKFKLADTDEKIEMPPSNPPDSLGSGLEEEPKKDVKHRNNVWFCQQVEIAQNVAGLPDLQSLPDEVKKGGKVKVLVQIVGPAVTTQAVKKDAGDKLGEKAGGNIYRVVALSDEIKPIIEKQLKITMG